MTASVQNPGSNEVPLLSPGTGVGLKALTPADDMDELFRRLLVLGSGNLHVTCVDGSEATLNSFSGYLDVAVKRVWATGTTATNIFGIK